MVTLANVVPLDCGTTTIERGKTGHWYVKLLLHGHRDGAYVVFMRHYRLN